jgi:hypothetical protein
MSSRQILRFRTHYLCSTVWILVMFAVVVVLAFVTLGLSGRDQPVNTASAGSQPHDIKVARLTLRPYGFEPKQIARPKRPFYLVVENRSGILDVNLQLDRVTGGRLREAQVKKRNQIWTDVLDLPPGSYRLSVAEHTNWVCDITITSH